MVLAPSRTRTPRSVAALRAFGWLLLTAGVVVVLYLVYSLLFTSRETDVAQSALADEWETTVPGSAGTEDHDLDAGSPGEEAVEDGGSEGADTAADATVEDPTVGAAAGFAGDPDRAVAVLEFSRPGARERPVAANPLYVVGDVTLAALRRGPGHYPRSAAPGEPGNFAVAGHRTTYGAPFFHLDDLRPGDEVHVTDRDGRRFTYRVREQQIVSPADAWVVEPDPHGRDRPTLTLTTCHPRFSARQRLVVWAELV